MKKSDVQIGATYLVKVASNLVPVKITREHDNGGWEGTSVKTGKTIRIKSPQRLRKALDDGGVASEPKPTKKKLTAAERKALQAQHPRKQADQENARSRDEHEGSPDGQTATSGGERAISQSAKKPKGETKKLSLIDAAAQVLARSDEPMNTKQMVDQVVAEGLWSSPAGKTPQATLYSSILRELKNKGDESRFEKVERGKFRIRTGKGA